MGNREQGYHYGYTEARKNLPEKTPLGKKIWEEIWEGTMIQTRSSWQPVLRGFTIKQNKSRFSNQNKFVISQRWTVGYDA